MLAACCCRAQASPLPERPAEVRIVQQQGRYQLLVDGQPFHVNGAGLGGGSQEALVAAGGNSFRTWQSGDVDKTLAMLDRARDNGLRVALGIEVARERHGFDYDDGQAVAQQLQRVRAEVARYKDHPAVLMWVVGNELNLEYSNPAVWNAVGQMADAIHQIDPRHPVMTTLAGFDAGLIALLKARAPSLDLIGIQLYGDIDQLPRKLVDSDWTGPYIVTEWGPTGHWESPLTSWGAPIEATSTEKAQALQQRYQDYVASDQRQGLGSYVFLWGNKQERTPTWYGLFLASGEATPGVDTMQYLWTGHWPANRAPALRPIQLDGRAAIDSVVLAAGKPYRAVVQARDGDGDPLAYRWYVLQESTAKSIGGDHEQVPAAVDVPLRERGEGVVELQAPASAGNYRLFVEVRDGHGHAAHANFPFQVSR
ncbi:hypothetical protein ABB29_01735 [Pseudoxanthomonas dokdonensis]|uniref:Glycoside hydrolase family 2 catalytic domain-containing protein n=1 Tax=Pseudoxanthomonas dokdonensis TaxID=344882 RepID=A0A0R0CYR7_9GAMM|nr:hypothetical protein ABB29_01735 [Pseudoxanthomonas dokdonensis]